MLKAHVAIIKRSMDRSRAAIVQEANVQELKEEIVVILELKKRKMDMFSSLNIEDI